MHKGELLALLLRNGERYVLGVPGNQACPLYDSIHRRIAEVRRVLTSVLSLPIGDRRM